MRAMDPEVKQDAEFHEYAKPSASYRDDGGSRRAARAYRHGAQCPAGDRRGGNRPGARQPPCRGVAARAEEDRARRPVLRRDRKSTRLNSSHLGISYAVFCLKKKNK